MHPARPRPRIIDKQRPEATTPKDKRTAKPSDHNMNLGVPNKLRHGADEAFSMLARRNAAIGGK
jgi:hypothetical protein